MIIALRPKQWVKNVLLFTAPAAAGVLNQEIMNLVLGFTGFVCASSLGYLINDWIDRLNDFKHPQKKSRPFASGDLNVNHLFFLLALLSLAIGLVCYRLPISFSYAILSYVFVSVLYTVYIKNLPVTEIIWLSLGFLLRAIAGSMIIERNPTGWFLVVVFFGSIFIVVTKRIAEKRAGHLWKTRNVLDEYSLQFLNSVLVVAISITLMTYALWIFAVHGDSSIAQLSIISFTTSVLLYAYHAEFDNAEAPEDLVTKDPLIVICAAFTIVSVLIVF